MPYHKGSQSSSILLPKIPDDYCLLHQDPKPIVNEITGMDAGGAHNEFWVPEISKEPAKKEIDACISKLTSVCLWKLFYK